VGVIQNDTNDYKQQTQHRLAQQTPSPKPYERNAEVVKINLSSSFNKSEQISAGLSTFDNKVYDFRAHNEKKHGTSSFQRVINRIVETGKKSKLPHVNKSKSSEYELINGYETGAEVKSKKRSSSSYKSYTLKSTEMEPISQSTIENTANLEPKKSNSKSKIDRNKSYSLSASLPSRNFKVVDDLKSLFDKITSSNHHKHNKNKVISANGDGSSINPNASMSAVLYSIESPAHFNSLKIEANERVMPEPAQIVSHSPISNLFTNKPNEVELNNAKESALNESQIYSRPINNGVVKLKMSQSFNADNEMIKRRIHDSFTVIKPPSNLPIKLSTFKTVQQPKTLELKQAELINNKIEEPVVQVVQVPPPESPVLQPITNNRVLVLKNNLQNSFSSTDADQDSPDSPRKGALKKLGIRDSSANRSPLKVRWKDMIEITNVTDDGQTDDDNDEDVADCRTSRSRVKAKKDDDSDEDVDIVDDEPVETACIFFSQR
jgi:hypothetical protein